MNGFLSGENNKENMKNLVCSSKTNNNKTPHNP